MMMFYPPGCDDVPSPEVLQRLVEDVAPGQPLVPAVRGEKVPQDGHVTWRMR